MLKQQNSRSAMQQKSQQLILCVDLCSSLRCKELVCIPKCYWYTALYCSCHITKHMWKLFGLWKSGITFKLLLFLQENKNTSRGQWFSEETWEQVYLINVPLVFQTFSRGNKNNLKLLITWTILQKVTADRSVSEQQPLLNSKWPEFFHSSVVKFHPTSIKSIIEVTASCPAHTRKSPHTTQAQKHQVSEITTWTLSVLCLNI